VPYAQRGECVYLHPSLEKVSYSKGSYGQNGHQSSTPKRGRKSQGLGEEIHNLEKGLIWYTEGSRGYEATQEKMARLRALMEERL